MGIVFKAEDLRLGRMVALKFLSDVLARDHHALQRFEREAKAASALNHPNICTIHEVGDFEGQPFIVMELLEGEPLSTRIRESTIDLNQGLELSIQAADALRAAHAKGIIHRDIKPANVFVTSQFGAKVLDFGLAKLIAEPRQIAAGVASPGDSSLTIDQSLTNPGIAIGTVAYMSPEQARGEILDERADIFSFGVMLYEISTGTLPFRGPSSVAILGAILYQPQTPASLLKPGLPRELERIINKALEKDREARYQNASDLHADLTHLKRTLDSGLALQRTRNFWPVALVTAAVLLIAVATIIVWRVRQPQRSFGPRTTVQSQIPSRRSIAVLGFKNLTTRPEVAWLSTALSEMLSTELAAGEALRVIPGENVAHTRIDLALADADTFSKETLARIKNSLGSDLVVLGSYADLGAQSGGQVRLDVRLQETAQGETIASVSETGTEANLFQLVTQAGSQLREKLGVKRILASEREDVRASLPSSPDITRLYSEGLKKLRVFDALAARKLLEQVVAAEPDYALGHSALSMAYSSLGYDQKATREAKQAFALSKNLSREDRLSIEGRYREATRNWQRAIAVYQSLWTSFPDNLEYGLRLAGAQVSSGKGRDAISTVQALRRLPSPSRDDPRIDLADARGHESLGEFDQELRLARQAASKAKDSGLLLARARILEGWALYRLGKPQESIAALRHAQDLYTSAGQRQGTARALETTGNVLLEGGDLATPRRYFEQALAVYREIGDRSGTANALNALANLLYTQGDYSGAKSMYVQSLGILREVGSKAGIAGALGNLANVTDSQGDLAGARKMHEQALAAFSEVGDERGASSTLANMGNVLLEQGDVLGARRAEEEALQRRRAIGYKSGIAFSSQNLGEVLATQGNLQGARQNYEQALAIRREMGQHGTAALTTLDLATLSIDERRPELAETLARGAIVEFANEKDLENEAVAQEVLARALLAQGKPADARAAIGVAKTLLPRSAAYPSQFRVRITAARVRAVANSNQAKSELEHLLTIAKQHGFLGYEFEIRLALGEIEMKSGNPRGRGLLQELERDAGNAGFGLIARNANEMLRSSSRR